MNVHVYRPIPAPLPPAEVTITMTETEARVLVEVLYHIGGSENGPRGVTQTLLGKLLAQSIERLGRKSLMEPVSGIYFRPEWPAGVRS